ncbi:MAG: hypothetical protein WC928_00010 [Patescibacteria group bacterium]|jgi:hypothetical protein
MKIKTGKTRIVFLVDNFAIKIAKPRFIRLFFRILSFYFVSKRSRDGYYKTYGRPSFNSFKRYALYSFYANLNEYNYSKKFNDPDIMPVIKKYIFGWIIVQYKGESFKNSFVSPFENIKNRKLSPETTGLHQYCFFNGRYLIVDYGDDSTIEDLIKTRHLR